MRTFAITLLAGIIAMPLASQEKLVESIEVRVVNIDVIVTDRAGNPVTGLGKGDFEILDNGKPQLITNLYEVRPEGPGPSVGGALESTPSTETAAAVPAPAEMRQRRVVLFIDNYSLHPFQRNEVLKSLDKFVTKDLRSGDEATLVAWNPGLKIVTPFTSDRAQLKAGIEAMSSRTNGGSMAMSSQKDMVRRQCTDALDAAKSRDITMAQAWDMCKGAVSAYSEQVAQSTAKTIEAMRLTSTTLAGLDGKKVMVIAGAHLPERPGLELNMWAFQTFSPYMRNLNQMQAMAETAHNTQVFSIEKFARQANADGVTVYVIDAADNRDYSSAEQAEATDTTQQFAAFTNTAMAYQTIARITGGMMVNSNNFDAAFTAVSKDLGYYYSLGYKPSEEAKSAKDRKLVVRMKNPVFRVRARQTYAPKSAEEQMNDRVVANIYHSGLKSEWPIKLTLGTPEKEGDRFSVPVTVSIPPIVTLLPQEGSLVGGFDVYLAVGTDGGAMSKVTKNSQPIKIPAAGEKDLRRKPMTYDVTIVVRPGESTLSIGVVDQISSVAGFARTKIVAK
jgi:VWFA-related protein